MHSKFKDTLQNLKTLVEANNCLQEFLASYKITTFAFTYYANHPNSINKLKYDYSSANFAPWHKHYLDEGYETIDTTLAIVYQTTLPVFWDLKQQVKQARTPKEKQMRLDGLAFKAQKGLSIPLHGPNEDFAVFLAVQMQGESCLEQWQELQFSLQNMAYCYYEQIKKILLITQEVENQYQLLRRELQVLQLTAQKYSVVEIAKKLHISSRTVNYHLQKANKKLGTRNKYQSVAKALAKELFLL